MVPTVDFMIMGFMRFYSKFLKTVSYSELHVVEKSSCKKTRIFKARNEIGNNEVGKFNVDTFGPSTFMFRDRPLSRQFVGRPLLHYDFFGIKRLSTFVLRGNFYSSDRSNWLKTVYFRRKVIGGTQILFRDLPKFLNSCKTFRPSTKLLAHRVKYQK